MILLPILVVLAVISALVTVVSFILYIRARLAERSHPDDEVDVLRDAGLNRKERFYQRIHFLSLFVFVALGVLILIIIAHRVKE